MMLGQRRPGLGDPAFESARRRARVRVQDSNGDRATGHAVRV